jgi:hypothetical protein
VPILTTKASFQQRWFSGLNYRVADHTLGRDQGDTPRLKMTRMCGIQPIAMCFECKPHGIERVRKPAQLRVLTTSTRKPPLSGSCRCCGFFRMAHPAQIEVVFPERVDGVSASAEWSG